MHAGQTPKEERHGRRIKDRHLLLAFEQYNRPSAVRKSKQVQVSCHETLCTRPKPRTDVKHAAVTFVDHGDSEQPKERNGLFNVRVACGVMGIFADDHHALVNSQPPPQAKKVADSAKEKCMIIAIDDQ